MLDYHNHGPGWLTNAKHNITILSLFYQYMAIY